MNGVEKVYRKRLPCNVCYREVTARVFDGEIVVECSCGVTTVEKLTPGEWDEVTSEGLVDGMSGENREGGE